MNRKLILYSDQRLPETSTLDQRLLRLIGTPYPRIGYIPSASDPERFWFSQMCSHYAALGASVDVYFELDMHFSEATLPTLLSCDAIHLSGGNTFYFLYWMQQRGMLPVLRDYVARGGVLIGVSAGAMLMTPEVSPAALCGDEPVEALRDPSALGLVPFYFLPHFRADDAHTAEVEAYQRSASLPLYACPDGGGVVIDGSSAELFGPVRKFEGLA